MEQLINAIVIAATMACAEQYPAKKDACVISVLTEINKGLFTEILKRKEAQDGKTIL